MKRFCASLIALVVSVMLFAERVSLDDATLVANHFMNAASVNHVKKATPAKKMVRKAMAPEDLFYLYENEDGEGWVLVAANDAMTPILAYSETGHISTDDMPSNLKTWLDQYNTITRRVEEDGVVASADAQNQWKALRKGTNQTTAKVIVGPLIQTTWNQTVPYNNLCPGSGSDKAYTGCVATAMAQVMNYWQWPVQGTGSHTYQPQDPNSNGQAPSQRYGEQSADFGATTYDWENMKNSYSLYTETEATAVATLMYHCGVAADMMYGNAADGGSGTYVLNMCDWEWEDTDGGCAQNALYTYFGYRKPIGYKRDGLTAYGTIYYDEWSEDEWKTMLKNELDLLHPIIYSGGSGMSNGHSFVCDGYDDADYFHFNWGWSGRYDGYFVVSNLVPGGTGAGGGKGDYTLDQDVLIGIVPAKEETPNAGSFILLTDINDLEDGDEVIIVNKAHGVAASTIGSNSSSSWFEQSTVTIEGSEIELDFFSEVTILTVHQDGDYWTLSNGGQRLVATAPKKLKFADSGASRWHIFIENEDATIENETSANGLILYQRNGTRFTNSTPPSASLLLPQLFYRRPADKAVELTRAGMKAVTVLENGQLVILRDNKKYSIIGQQIQ